MKIVIITIKKGVPTIKVQGCKGPECKELTRELESDLGTVTKQHLTQEFSKADQRAEKGARL